MMRIKPNQTAYFILCILQGILGSLIELLQHIHLNNPALATSNVVQYTIDGLLGVVTRYGGLGVG